MTGPLKYTNDGKCFTHSDAISVDLKDRLAHGAVVVGVGVAFEELLTEPNVETFVVFRFQFVALATQAVRSLMFCVFNLYCSYYYSLLF